jgi:hypothetical protein
MLDTCIRRKFGVPSCNGYWHQTEGLRKIPHGSRIVILYYKSNVQPQQNCIVFQGLCRDDFGLKGENF